MSDFSIEKAIENLERAVVCETFCEGVSNEALEAVTLEEVVAELRDLVKLFKGYQGLKMTRASRILSHFTPARSSTIEHRNLTPKVGGSSPPAPTNDEICTGCGLDLRIIPSNGCDAPDCPIATGTTDTGDYEYRTIEGPRKGLHEPPEGDGWEYMKDQFSRGDFSEFHTYRRLRAAPTTPTTEGEK